MFTSRFTTKAIAGIPLALLASAAFAHPKPVSSTPVDQTEVTAPTKIELEFSGILTTQFPGTNFVITEMPGMSGHSPVKVGAKVSAGDDAGTMVITPAQLLTTGTYRVEWRAVSSDTHPMTGNFTFKVK